MATSTFSVSISINEFDEGRPGKMLETIPDAVQFVREQYQVNVSAEIVGGQVILQVDGLVENVDVLKQLY